MKYSAVERKVRELRAMADFLEEHGVMLPNAYFSTEITCSLTATDYVRIEGSDEWETILLEDETKKNLRRFLDAVGTCDKDYRDDRIVVTKNFPGDDRVMVRGTVDRQLACKKVVTGKKFVKEQLIPSRWEEEVEWKCDDNISLLKLVS